MDSFRICSACSSVFYFIDSIQETCIKCKASLRELDSEEAALVLKQIDGKVSGSCSCSSKGCSC